MLRECKNTCIYVHSVMDFLLQYCTLMLRGLATHLKECTYCVHGHMCTDKYVWYVCVI